MENVIFNDLKRRGFDIDVGLVPYNVKKENGKHALTQLEVDFMINRGDTRCYIQSALSVEDPEKKEQESASLLRIPDSFQKIVVVRDFIYPRQDDKGLPYIGVEDFLLNESFIET